MPVDKQEKSGSASNFFFNATLILLICFAGFLSYSLYSKIKSDKPAQITIENKNVASVIIQVEVLNGCGASGVADRFTDYLRRNNFDVVQTGNYLSFDIDKSLIIDRIGNRANAQKIADALGIDRKNIVQQLNHDYFLDISLVVGKDFNQLKPYNKE